MTDPVSVPTFSFPFVLDCHNYYELMVAQGVGRSPMTSSDAETDSKPIIIIIIIIILFLRQRLGIAMQRGNAAAVRGTLPQTDCPS